MKLFLILSVVISTSNFFVDAMHGGENANIEQVPYQVELDTQYKKGSWTICGAAILSERWIITAAHCATIDATVRLMRIRSGASVPVYKKNKNGVLHNISRIVIHEQYSKETRWNSDISLIELADPIKFDEKSQPISIAKKSPIVGNVVTVSGYGDDKDEFGVHLKMGHQPVISQRACREAYEKAPQKIYVIDNRVFCTNSTSTDLGRGDSGGPVVLDGKLIGIATEANESPLPNIHVNVAHYYDWIVNVTGIKFD